MNRKIIANAKIEKWWIRCDPETVDNHVTIKLEIRSSEGTAVVSYDIQKITKLFNILDITDLNNLKNTPCIVYIDNGLMKTLGNFLYKYYDFYDNEKYQNENWMDWNLVKDYYKATEEEK